MNRIIICFFAAVMILALSMSFFMENSLTERSTMKKTEIIDACFEQAEDGCSMTLAIPDSDTGGMYVSFGSSHYCVSAEIDGEEVYRLEPSEKSRTESTGYSWNYIRLKDSDAGKQMTIHLWSPYGTLRTPDAVYIGEVAAVASLNFSDGTLRIILALLIMIIGVTLLIYTLLMSGIKGQGLSIYFSLFSIFLSVWALTGTNAVSGIVNFPLALMYLNHYSLMLMPMAFLQFIRRIFHNTGSKMWDATLFLGIATVFARVVMDTLRIADLRETLFVTQGYIFLFVIHSVVLAVDELKKNKITVQLGINGACLALIFIATVAELLIFRRVNRQSSYGMLCFLVYIVLMTINIIKQSQKIRKRADEAEIYRNLAFTDVLTGVYSRTAFMNDINRKDDADIKNKVVFMFDLNNLKKCNDQFGHENGDRYITSVSGVLSDVIGADGRCYRIGGDEFSAIMPFMGQNDIDNRLKLIEEKVAQLNKAKFVVEMSVACGYAVFSPENDSSLDDTMRRADAMMYDNKQKMKAVAAAK